MEQSIGRMAMSNYSWHPDNKPYVLTSGDGKIIIRDGYSQWLLGPGADFNLFQEIKPDNDNADYNLVSIIKDLNNPSQPIEFNGEATTLHQINDHILVSRNQFFGGNARPFDFMRPDEVDLPHPLITPVPIRKASVPDEYAPEKVTPYLPPDGLDIEKTVIVGIMDDSLNLVHERFSHEAEDGTLSSRIDYAWMQDAISPAVSSVPYGAEITGSAINDARRELPDASEHVLLQHLGVKDSGRASYQPEPLNFRTSHGTFVADLACGYPVSDAQSQLVRMIGVKLPVLSSQDTSGATLIAAIISGSNYIFERAELMSKSVGVALPVVLNFSYGFFGGPHNGRHIVERALALHAEGYRKAVSKLKGGDDVPIEITLPAGNSHLSQTHAATNTAAADGEFAELPLNLVLQPEDRTSSFVEFWLPNGVSDTEIKIAVPTGEQHSFNLENLKKPFGYVLTSSQGSAINREEIIARIKLDQPNGAPKQGHRWRVLLAIAPTRVLDQPRLAAPGGIWQIRITGKLPKGAKLESWIQRDVSVSGLGQVGRQAYFTGETYIEHRFDPYGDPRIYDEGISKIKRDGTLSGIATLETNDPNIGFNVVGSYFHSSGSATPYSSAGSDSIQGPRLLASTDSSRSLPGILASGTYSGTINPFNGTSAAAPQLARVLAEAIREINAVDRDKYDRDAVIKAALDDEPVLRPDPHNPEYVTNSRMREERVSQGRLSSPIALKKNIQRGRYA